MNPVRIAFAGVGYMGQVAHLRNYVNREECQVVAIAEPRPELAQKVAQLYGIPKIYSSHRDLVTDSLPYIEDRRAMTIRKLTNPRMKGAGSVRCRRRVMVEGKEYTTRIVQLFAAHLLEVVDRHRAGSVGAEQEVDVTDDDLARTRRAFGMRR